MSQPFADTINTIDHLLSLYRAPGEGAIGKETDILDSGCRDFIAVSSFVVVGTADAEGNQDTSPRGGPPGFVKVLDETRLVIPDLSGNNRLDSLRNIVAQPKIGLMFVIPGLGETLRLNGSACLTTDDAVLDLFTEELRRPTCAIGVKIDHGYIHCAKSFRRGDIWKPEMWPTVEGRPSAGQILVDHSGAGDFLTGNELEDMLEKSYVEDLAADRPESTPPAADRTGD